MTFLGESPDSSKRPRGGRSTLHDGHAVDEEAVRLDVVSHAEMARVGAGEESEEVRRAAAGAAYVYGGAASRREAACASEHIRAGHNYALHRHLQGVIAGAGAAGEPQRHVGAHLPGHEI